MRPPVASSLFTLSLLHDIGKVIAAQFLAEDFARALAMSRKGGGSDLEAERKCLGADHTVIGHWICERWRLPEEIAAAVRYHHQPPANGELPEGVLHAVRGTCLANQAAHVIENGSGGEDGGGGGRDSGGGDGAGGTGAGESHGEIDLALLAEVGVSADFVPGWIEETRARSREVVAQFRR
jgi:hypothetical protein